MDTLATTNTAPQSARSPIQDEEEEFFGRPVNTSRHNPNAHQDAEKGPNRHRTVVRAASVGRLLGHDRWVPWRTSLKNTIQSSVLNLFFVILPLAWASHLLKWRDDITFSLCFLALIPMVKMFDFGGQQLAYYLGSELGDLAIVTLNNLVEVTLNIILLINCQLRLLQSSITGLLLLRLLLVPGLSFLFDGASLWEQTLLPHTTSLNHALLTLGVLAILLPTALYTSLDRPNDPRSDYLSTDATRADILAMSRGIAIVLILIYLGSRVYLHTSRPEKRILLQGEGPALSAMRDREHELGTGLPKANIWTCLLILVVVGVLMGVTVEFLTGNIPGDLRDGIRSPWFGVFLLPLLSASADGAIACRHLIQLFIHRVLKIGGPPPREPLAQGRSIDLNIQFVLFWTPFLVLLAWCIRRPLHILFDFYQAALLLGACFLVNRVTGDAKTNWAKGLVLVGFYIMIMIVLWYYPGSELSRNLLRCGTLSVAARAQ